MRSLLRLLIFAPLVAACGTAVWQPALYSPDARVEPDRKNRAPLQVHLRSGEVIVLATWRDLPGDSGLSGEGTRYDLARAPVGSGSFVISRDSVALLETSEKSVSRPAGLTGLAIWTTLAGVTAVACVADPKSCFGSCPTFYLEGADDRPVAEGFSGSVARSLEATDLDHLVTARPSGPVFRLVMRNEALETHAVRSVRLLVAPRPSGGRVLATPDGALLRATSVLEPSVCRSGGRDCLDLVRDYDGREWIVPTDPRDLGAPDTLEVEFPATAGPVGLVIGARQSFVSTYLFYQTIAATGRSASAWLVRLEREGPAALGRAREMMDLVGTLRVERDDGGWRPAGTFHEPGPMASDVVVLPLGEGGSGPIRLRLVMAKGAWRVGWLALARLGGAVTPLVLLPSRITRAGEPDSLALARLLDPDRYLVTYPGDRYTIEVRFPRLDARPEIFLETRGYYYEWMRPDWTAGEDRALLALVASDPRAALRRLAPSFKLSEPDLERRFWASRFGRGR